MTKSSFFENSRRSSISGGNFVHTENRISQQRESVFHGSIYGYTHTAANEGPVIGFYNQVSIESDVGRGGQHSPTPGLYQRGHDLPPIENGGATRSDIVHEEPEPMTLTDMRISPGGDRSLDTELARCLPLELEEEFQTLSQEMQRYVKYLLNRQRAGNSASGLLRLDCPKRGAAQATKPSSQRSREP